MKKLFYILFTFLSVAGFAQTKIGPNQIQDGAITAPKIQTGAVTQIKLAPDALRPVASGTLSDFALVFGLEYRKKYNLSITSDVSLTLKDTVQTTDSYIFIETIPDGSHTLSFPSTWKYKNDNRFDPTQTQRIELYFTGSLVYVEIFNSDDIVIATLLSAIMDEGTDDLTLSFSSGVNITTAGWSATASGGAVTVSAVTSGSGTPTVIFDLSRNITSGETMTISYNPSTGATTSLTGNEIAVISNQIVDTGEGALPENVVTVDDSGGKDYTTIQAASNAATAGQTVLVYSGTYRETVIAKTGVTYQAAAGETPIISGLETADGGWTVHSGNIYKKTISINGGNLFIDNNNTNTTLHAIQIFKDGEMQHLARWPNVATMDDLFDRTKLRQRNSTSNWQSNTITDSGIPNISGGWTGGTVWITGWYAAHTHTISSHSGTTINFQPSFGDLRFHQYYYLTGKLGALDQAKEWHYESGILYFWQTGGGSPTGVEYKARNWGFDVRGKANVTIKGLTFIGCDPIQADVNSNNTTVDGIRATYTNHAFLLTGGGDLYTNARRTGLQIIGASSVLKNSEIKYSASQMVWLGQNCRMENNLIEYGNYEGNYGAGVNFWNPNRASNQVVTRNTLRKFGRSAVDFSEHEGHFGVGTQEHRNMDISYNDISESLMLSADGGQFYGSVYTDLTGTRVHHNWIRDSHAQHTPTAAYVVGVAAAFYLDQACGPVLFDHNITSNNNAAGFHTQQNGAPKRHAGKSWVINNTFAEIVDDHNNQQSYLTITTDTYDYQRNNIYADNKYINWFEAGSDNTFPWTAGKGNVANSISRGTNPLFEGGAVDPGTVASPEEYFQLQSGSPGVNAGTTIPSSEVIPNFSNNTVLTEDAVGAPDIGAYERGATPWVAGYNSVAPEENVLLEDNNSTFTTYSVTPTTFSNSAYSGGTATFFNTDDGQATINMTGTAFEWYAEKFNSHGIIEIQVDDVRQDCDSGTGGTQDCDLYQNTTVNNSQLIFSKTGMSAGAHTIELIVRDKNASSSNTYLVHDVIKITAP